MVTENNRDALDFTSETLQLKALRYQSLLRAKTTKCDQSEAGQQKYGADVLVWVTDTLIALGLDGVQQVRNKCFCVSLLALHKELYTVHRL